MVQTPVRPTPLSPLSSATAVAVRHDWTAAEIQALLDLPLMDVVYQAQTVHRQFQPHNEIQLATLLSVKTGGCAENCAYCPQSSHYDTTVDPEAAMSVDTVLASAKKAQEDRETNLAGLLFRVVRLKIRAQKKRHADKPSTSASSLLANADAECIGSSEQSNLSKPR